MVTDTLGALLALGRLGQENYPEFIDSLDHKMSSSTS